VTKHIDAQCRAFQLAIDVLGRPWNALLLYVLQGGPLRFRELATAAQGPGDKVLSARLKQLERCGLVVRNVDPGPPVRVSYQLTSQGRGFYDVASAIERWGRSLEAPAPPGGKPVSRAAARAKAARARR